MRTLLLGTLLLASTAFALPPETWVVSIGNNEGMGTDVTLLYAESDAKEVAEALKSTAKVPGARTQLLLGEDAESVRRALVELNALIRMRGADGTPSALVVFYSGHADATALHLGTSQLELEELKKLVAGSAAGVRVLIVDACRSGALTRVKGVAPAASFAIEMRDTVATEGLAIITSSASGESAQESDRLGSSLFTHHLVNALRGAADSNDDGRVTLTEAYGYTYAQTLRSSGETVSLQHPTYSYDVKGRGELVLSVPAEAQGRVGRLVLTGDALHVVTREKREGPVVAEVLPQGGRRELLLPAQSYFIQERRSAEFREYEVTLAAGSVVELSKIPYRAVRYDRLVRQRGGERTVAPHLMVLGGMRGPMVNGSTVGPQLQVGGGVDLPAASLGLRVRGFTDSGASVDNGLQHRDWELGVGVLVSRSIDLPVVTLTFGLLLEYVHFRQDFTTAVRIAPPRSASGGSFAGLVALELPLGAGFGLRLEGGPVASLFPLTQVEPMGMATTTVVRGAVSGYVSGGLTWRQ